MSNEHEEQISAVITDLRIAVELLKAKAETFDKIAADVQVLKEARQQALGERTIMISLAIFIGGILQALAANLFSKH